MLGDLGESSTSRLLEGERSSPPWPGPGLVPPGEGIGIFFRKGSPEAPLAEGVYLRVDGPDFQPELPVETVGEPLASHRETRLQTVPYPVVRESSSTCGCCAYRPTARQWSVCDGGIAPLLSEVGIILGSLARMEPR